MVDTAVTLEGPPQVQPETKPIISPAVESTPQKDNERGRYFVQWFGRTKDLLRLNRAKGALVGLLNRGLHEKKEDQVPIKVDEVAVEKTDYHNQFVLSEERELRRFVLDDKKGLRGEEMDNALKRAAGFKNFIRNLDIYTSDNPDANVVVVNQSRKDVIPQLYSVLAHPNFLKRAGITEVALDITQKDMDVLSRNPDDLENISPDLKENPVKRELFKRLLVKLPQNGIRIVASALDEEEPSLWDRKMKIAYNIQKAAQRKGARVLTLISPDISELSSTTGELLSPLPSEITQGPTVKEQLRHAERFKSIIPKNTDFAATQQGILLDVQSSPEIRSEIATAQVSSQREEKPDRHWWNFFRRRNIPEPA